MKTKGLLNPCAALLTTAFLAFATMPVLGQAPVISSFSQNGQLVCTNLQPGSTATVEWASSVLGPWRDNWTSLAAVKADSNGSIRVEVPMFYRVRSIGTNLPLAEMSLIPAGSFQMGDAQNETPNEWGERPIHSVSTSEFYIDRFEVTKALWDTVFGWATNHGYSFESGALGKALDHPAHSMTWYDAVKWCNARSEMEGRTPAYYTNSSQTAVYRRGTNDLRETYVRWNTGYRLPTESEWERAARGGVNGRRFPWATVDTITHSRANYFSYFGGYDVSPTSGYHPWYNDGIEPYTSPVGESAPNGYGLCDMAGNVWEWCWDWWAWNSYLSSSGTDPRGPLAGYFRVRRGGSWKNEAVECRAACRSYLIGYRPQDMGNETGFRCVLPLSQ